MELENNNDFVYSDRNGLEKRNQIKVLKKKNI